jgi:DNA-directed RNA polymerase specialized sigma24 family protein
VESHAIVGAYAVVSFWSFLAICAVAGMILDYRKKQLAVQSLKLAAEHGQNIDPAVIKALLSQQKQDNELNPAALLVGGVITVSVGVGVVLLAFLDGQLSDRGQVSSVGERLDLDRALALLPQDVRLCVVLGYAERMSHREICEATGFPLGTVKSHIARGAARLPEILSAYGPQDCATAMGEHNE